MGRLACVNVSLSPQTGVAAPENAAGGRVDFVCERLCGFSPKVEPRQMEPGIFWLSADGLEAVYPSLTHWALLLQTDLAAAGFETTVALGFDRFYTYALAKSAARLYPDSPLRIRVLHSRAEEARAARKVPLEHVLALPELRQALIKLDIRTVGDFQKIPESSIRSRFGRGADEFYRFSRRELLLPTQPYTLREVLQEVQVFNDPIDHLDHILAVTESLLQLLCAKIKARGETLAAIAVFLHFDNGEEMEFEIVPARPTLDLGQLLRLCRLTLCTHATKAGAGFRPKSVQLPRGVLEIRLRADTARPDPEQLTLFPHADQDLARADRVLDKIRAEFGDDAVVVARIEDAFLPERAFRWDRLERARAPAPPAADTPCLVRRLHTKGTRLPAAPRAGFPPVGDRPVRESHGPYVLSGSWWTRAYHREYYYVSTASGRLAWIYYDCLGKEWILQGEVE